MYLNLNKIILDRHRGEWRPAFSSSSWFQFRRRAAARKNHLLENIITKVVGKEKERWCLYLVFSWSFSSWRLRGGVTPARPLKENRNSVHVNHDIKELFFFCLFFSFFIRKEKPDFFASWLVFWKCFKFVWIVCFFKSQKDNRSQNRWRNNIVICHCRFSFSFFGSRKTRVFSSFFFKMALASLSVGLRLQPS